MGNKNTSKIILFSVVFLIIGLIGGYFIGAYLMPQRPSYRTFNGASGPQGFQLNASAQAQMISVLQNATSLSQVDSYCSANMAGCLYYCRSVNSQYQYCPALMNNSGGAYFRRG